jgi:di/tricarboxylate transporter
MIYGPGGYKYNDFLIIGTPMQIVLWLLSVALLTTTTSSNFYFSWIICFGLLVVVMGFMSYDLGAVFRRATKKAATDANEE